MGCDIHLYKEKQVNGEWVSADKVWSDEYDEGFDVPWEERFNDRDYCLFGFIAGVRREIDGCFAPRGLPANVCSLVKCVSDRWGGDGHSHSYLYLTELKDSVQMFRTQTITVIGMKDKEEIEGLKRAIASEEETDWSLLYPYCSWSSCSNYTEFSVEVPASIQLDGVQRIINLFDGVDGDNHRIVFWFDN